MATSITTIPYTITTSGRYRLDTSATLTDGVSYGITINADDVYLDLNGYTLRDTYGTGTSSRGVYAVNRRNITVENGTLKGFLYGLNFEDTTANAATHGGHLVRNVKAINCTFRGLRVDGPSCRIEDNHIHLTGGTTFFSGAFAVGIESLGPGAMITGNSISETQVGAGLEALGVSLSSYSDGSVVKENVSFNRTPPGGGYGLWFGGAGDAVIEFNLVMTWPNGIGISSPTFGSYRGNNFFNCTTAVVDNSANTVGQTSYSADNA